MKTKALAAALAIGLFASASAEATILQDNFDPINAGNWQALSNATTLGVPGPEFFDGQALYFDGNGFRAATTIALDLTNSNTISFRLKIGDTLDTATFENADPGEDVHLQYSLNGTNFFNIAIFDTEDPLYADTWGLADIAIPVAAMTNATYIRWAQASHSGSGFDNWAIDNVHIDGGATGISEPASLAVFGLGLAGLGIARRRRRKA